MGINILDKIYKAVDMSGGVKDIVVFTTSFKAYGTIVKDNKDNLKDILTLKNATICHHFDECSCNINSPKYEWLNINEEKIIAFSILGYMTCENQPKQQRPVRQIKNLSAQVFSKSDKIDYPNLPLSAI